MKEGDIPKVKRLVCKKGIPEKKQIQQDQEYCPMPVFGEETPGHSRGRMERRMGCV
jgi:hypothetical protein